ncbi:MAG: DUF3644 domain-containing protein [Pseudomonadota bacterium]|nr:DUF3644 domain-containing protein [Pseudomonadota bacterium]
MRLFGSYKRLRDNGVSAMVGAIEIYNKPRLTYRDECAVILMVNAWELLFKATLSKNKVSIYYPKRRGEDYRTLGWADASRKVASEGHWPAGVAQHPVALNIEHLAHFRDNAVHFYNAAGFGLLVHALGAWVSNTPLGVLGPNDWSRDHDACQTIMLRMACSRGMRSSGQRAFRLGRKCLWTRPFGPSTRLRCCCCLRRWTTGCRPSIWPGSSLSWSSIWT